MSDSNKPLLIYNLFPRVFKSIFDWPKHVPFVASMKFNAIYLNPFNETGGSRSLYAIKNHYRLNQEFLAGADPNDFSPLKEFIDECRENGLSVIMDLVINHTANESELLRQYPNWFKWDNGNPVHPFAIDPADSSVVTVWGDLAEINYEYNADYSGLLEYWDKLVAFYQDLGVKGFRCDAAYKVPCTLWTPLIASAHKRDPQTVFLAETLGCKLDQVQALGSCGFNYLFNSSKWWNFEKPWCIEQHGQFKNIAPSISFPESHDTPRQASQPPQTESMQKCRYLFSALFSKGLLMPVGYELGALQKLDVVFSRPEDLLAQKWDISSWINQINDFKLQSDILTTEGAWRAVTGFDWNLLGLIREDIHGSIGVLINKDWYNGFYLNRNNLGELSKYEKMIRPFGNINEEVPNNSDIPLGPSEIVLFE